MLYDSTPEHAEHVRCEKDAYTIMDVESRCIYLASIYQRKYEYDAKIKFEAVQEKPGVYEALLWGCTNCGTRAHHSRDMLKALVVWDCDAATLVAINDSDNKEFILSESCRGSKDSPAVTVPISVGGIPLVALQYTALRLRVECPIPPPDAVGTFAILPLDNRRMVAIRSHVIKTFHQRTSGYGIGKLYICSGMIGDMPSSAPCCVVM